MILFSLICRICTEPVGRYAFVPMMLVVFGAVGASVCHGQAARPKGSVVLIDWTALSDSPNVERAGVSKNLKMRIPSEYVLEVYRDRTGEGERVKRVRNNGIEIVDILAWLPDLVANADGPNTAGDRNRLPGGRKGDIRDRLLVQLNAMAGMRPSSAIRESVEHGIERRTIYRLADQHGLERYREIYCGTLEPREEAKPRFPDEQSPKGCREIAGDEVYLTPDREDSRVWISCGRGERATCALRFFFRRTWSARTDFVRSELSRWSYLRDKSEELLGRFVLEK